MSDLEKALRAALENQITMHRGNWAEYKAKLDEGSSLDENALYFIEDAQSLYMGSKLIAQNNVRIVSELPEVGVAVPRTIYVVESEDGSVVASILSADGSKFDTLINTSTMNVTTDQVKFSSKVTVNVGEALGGIADGTEFEAGTTLSAFITALTTKEIRPTVTQPSLSLSVNPSAQVECGTQQSEQLTATFNKGAYTGQVTDTGVTASTYTFKAQIGAEEDTEIAPAQPGNTFTHENVTIPEGTVTYTAIVDHTAGVNPRSNTGKEYSELAIKAGQKTAKKTITGVRKYFYVADTEFASGAPSDTGAVRALTKSGMNPTKGTKFAITIEEGTKRVVVAYPEKLGEITEIKSASTNFDYKGSFQKSTVSVEGANSYEAINYNVYCYLFEGGLTADTYNVVI